MCLINGIYLCCIPDAVTDKYHLLGVGKGVLGGVMGCVCEMLRRVSKTLAANLLLPCWPSNSSCPTQLVIISSCCICLISYFSVWLCLLVLPSHIHRLWSTVFSSTSTNIFINAFNNITCETEPSSWVDEHLINFSKTKHMFLPWINEKKNHAYVKCMCMFAQNETQPHVN